MRRFIPLILLCILAGCLILPFSNRPLHIDDPMFVWAARHLADHPTDFYGFAVNWMGREHPFGSIFPIPPLMSYFLATAAHVVGWRELSLHLACFPITILNVIGVYFLSARFCRRPFLSTLIFLLCPAFVISSTTLMCDPLLLCFWTWAITFWVWADRRSPWLLPLAGLCAAAAVVTKSTSLGLIPLLFLHAILFPATSRQRVLQAFSLSIPLLTVVAYELIYHHLYGITAFQNAVRYSTLSQRALNIPAALRILNTLIFTGGTGCSAALLLLAVASRKTLAISLAAIAGFTLLLASAVAPPAGWADSSTPHLSSAGFAFYLQLSLLLFAAVLILFSCAGQLRPRRQIPGRADHLFLLAWIISLLIFSAFLNWSINVRSMLPMLPALCILAVRATDKLPRLPRLRVAISLSLSAILTIAVTWGDYQLARTGKTAANTLADQMPALQQTTPGSRVWFTGHWGFQYYLQLRGFTALDTSHPQYQPGDYVIFPTTGFGGLPQASGFQLVRQITIGSPQWVSTAQPNLAAGFYHSDGTSLPFVFGSSPAESFSIVRVTPDSKVSP
jgi:4-amino-4-deoxy-L-arabinose transferase-like glycosyltransferase